MKLNSSTRILLLTFLLCGCPLAASAQTSQVTGRITDSAGAVVPGASVAVTRLATDVKRETTTNDEGYYTVPLLQPGLYQVSAQKPGFKVVTRTGINLDVGQAARVDLVLEVGQVSEVIEVVSDRAIIETETATLSNVRTQKAISELPINSRNFTMLVHLSAGSVPTSTQASGAVPITAKRGV